MKQFEIISDSSALGEKNFVFPFSRLGEGAIVVEFHEIYNSGMLDVRKLYELCELRKIREYINFMNLYGCAELSHFIVWFMNCY